jgi:hypothetical protein
MMTHSNIMCACMIYERMELRLLVGLFSSLRLMRLGILQHGAMFSNLDESGIHSKAVGTDSGFQKTRQSERGAEMEIVYLI